MEWDLVFMLFLQPKRADAIWWSSGLSWINTVLMLTNSQMPNAALPRIARRRAASFYGLRPAVVQVGCGHFSSEFGITSLCVRTPIHRGASCR